jgi:hypothetical protein
MAKAARRPATKKSTKRFGNKRSAPKVPRAGLFANPAELAIVLKRFENPDEVREFARGRFELVKVGGMTIGRARYEPSWRWSIDVGPGVGSKWCSVEHLGLVLEGVATAAFEDGTVYELTPGTVFYIPPKPHDSWVVGDKPYVSLHFLGASHYAK